MDIKPSDTGVFEFRTDAMRVPARLFTSEALLDALRAGETGEWSSLAQLRDVASLPGVVSHVCGLADLHPGYGFPVGGVAAFDAHDGLVMVGGVGFDINCGVRVLRTDLSVSDVRERHEELADALFEAVPAGLGVPGELRVEVSEMDELLRGGARFVVERGYGSEDDLSFIEDGGMLDADPNAVSLRAKQRNIKQVGTLGSGNHYLEVQYVDEIFDDAARIFGLEEGSVVIMLHCGSRGLGHQVGQEYLDEMSDAMPDFNLQVLSSELVGAPISSELGMRYLNAVRAASNAAFANRQMIAHLTRQAVASVFEGASVETLYEVGHNTAKLESHVVGGVERELIVHRKGSTRAFGPGHVSLPERYRSVGQPIPVGGTMGTASYLLRATPRAMELAFGSAIHGAGRSKSRVESKRTYDADRIVAELRERGIIVKGRSLKGISEEAPGSYKDIEQVVAATTLSGIAARVVRLKPLISIKG